MDIGFGGALLLFGGLPAIVAALAAITIIASIAAHGLTDTLGARWIGRRAKEERGRTAAGGHLGPAGLD